jgi:coproporphyrinogen III oxidase
LKKCQVFVLIWFWIEVLRTHKVTCRDLVIAIAHYPCSTYEHKADIYTSKQRFGGGMDFTPIYKNEDDCQYIHESIKATCGKFNIEYYPKFKKQRDDYFFLQHRKEPRGMGGIFL